MYLGQMYTSWWIPLNNFLVSRSSFEVTLKLTNIDEESDLSWWSVSQTGIANTGYILPAELRGEYMKYTALICKRWKNWSVSSFDLIAFVGLPRIHHGFPIPAHNFTEIFWIVFPRLHNPNVIGGSVFLQIIFIITNLRLLANLYAIFVEVLCKCYVIVEPEIPVE